MAYLYRRRCKTCNDVYSVKEISEEVFDATRHNMALEEGYEDSNWTLTMTSNCGSEKCIVEKSKD